MDLSTIKDELYTFSSPKEREGIERVSELYSSHPELGEEVFRSLHEKRKSKYPEKKKQLLTEQKERRWKEELESSRRDLHWRNTCWKEESETRYNKGTHYRNMMEILGGYSMIDDCGKGNNTNKIFRFSKDIMPIVYKAVIHYREYVTQEVKLEYTKFPEKKEEEDEKKGEKKEVDDEEIDDMEDDDDFDMFENITIDGVEYQHNKEDHVVLRVDDFEEVGKWNCETGEIYFDDEE